MGGGFESRCVGRVCGADGAVRQVIVRTIPSKYFHINMCPVSSGCEDTAV